MSFDGGHYGREYMAGAFEWGRDWWKVRIEPDDRTLWMHEEVDSAHEILGEPYSGDGAPPPWRCTEKQLKRLALLDAQKWICAYCGAKILRFEHAEIDHVVPKSRGGSDERANLVAACRLCNQKKGSRV